MTTLYREELVQTPAANRTDWLSIRSAPVLLTSMVCCAFVIRIIVVASNFLGIAAPSLDHGQFGAEMGWVARSLALGDGFSSPFFPSTGPTALVPPLFPYLLAGVFLTFGLYTAKSAFVILSLDSLLSALTCIPVYLSLTYAAGERPAQFAGWLWVNLSLRNLFFGSSGLGLCLNLFPVRKLLLFCTTASLAGRLLGVVRLRHSLWSHSSLQSFHPFCFSISSFLSSLEGPTNRGRLVAPWHCHLYCGELRAPSSFPLRRRLTPPRCPFLDWILELSAGLSAIRTAGCT
jgi:hypothetical protein